MDMKRFTELMVKTVEAAMPNDVKEYATIEIREVVKFNDKKLHAIMLTDPERTVRPSIYLEDLYKRYEEGESMSDLAKYVIEINTMPIPCEIQNVSFRRRKISAVLRGRTMVRSPLRVLVLPSISTPSFRL